MMFFEVYFNFEAIAVQYLPRRKRGYPMRPDESATGMAATRPLRKAFSQLLVRFENEQSARALLDILDHGGGHHVAVVVDLVDCGGCIRRERPCARQKVAGEAFREPADLGKVAGAQAEGLRKGRV